MKTRDFDKLAVEILSPVLCGEKGYAFDKGVYCRETETDLRRIITFDYNCRTHKSFRVMVGVNSSVVDEGYGLYLLKYFTGGSLSDTPREIPCADEMRTRQSLTRVRDNLDTMILPFLESVQSPEQLVDMIEELGPQYCKYRAYFEEKTRG